MSREILMLVDALAREKNVDRDVVFGAVEAALARQGRRPEDSNLAEMDALWDEAKAAERA